MERKEAIEVIKKNWPDSSFTRLRDALETLIPELKESEDEKIRKQIKAFIKSRGSQITQSKTDAWLAWLEKQGEHANFRNKIQIGDKVTRNEDGVLVNLSQLNRVAKKQGEQKPVPKFKVGDTMRTLQEVTDGYTDGLPVIVSIDNEYYRCNNEIIAIKDQDNYEYPPINRKHNAWSEEDETVLNNLIYALANDRIGNNREEYVNWLKSLKDRVQPKQEWSEEDEQLINEVAECLRKYARKVQGGNSKVYVLSLADRIESLRPQSQWKPSDEQMKALQESIGIVGELTLKGECLKELVEQLKAL